MYKIALVILLLLPVFICNSFEKGFGYKVTSLKITLSIDNAFWLKFIGSFNTVKLMADKQIKES